MILKVQRPLYPLNAPYLVHDKTKKVCANVHPTEMPYDVQQSCRFGKAFWTTRFVGQKIEFLRQVENQEW